MCDKLRTETEIKKCGPLPMIENAVLIHANRSYVVGDTAHLRCELGYTPAAAHPSHSSRDEITSVSPLIVECLDDSTWSTPQRTCQSTFQRYIAKEEVNAFAPVRLSVCLSIC